MQNSSSFGRFFSHVGSLETFDPLSLTSRRRIFTMSQPINKNYIQDIFLRAKLKVKVVLFWSSIVKDIRLYGTGSSLFDGSMNYKECLPLAMEKKKVKRPVKESNIVEISKKCVIMPAFMTFKVWNFILGFGLVYTCIVMPVVLAFKEVKPFNVWFVFEVLIDCIYIVDIIVNANLAFKDSSKKIVYKHSDIIKNYLKGYFIIDLLSIIPFRYFFSNSPKFNSYIKIIRVGRLSGVLKILKIDKFLLKICGGRESTYVAMNRLIISLGLILLLVHFTACIWNFLPKADYYSPSSWIVRKNDLDKSAGSLYLNGFYFAVTTILTVGLGDYSAYSKSEMTLCIILELAGICFYSFILGVMTSLLTSIDQKEIYLNSKVQIANLFAADIKTSKIIQKNMEKEIRKFYEFNSLDDDQRQEIWFRIPKKMKYDICVSMYGNKIFNLFFWRKQEKVFCSSFIPRLNYLFLREKEIVFAQGDYPDNCYFLMAGRVSFVFGERNIVFKTMIAGSYFGEIGILERNVREFGAMALVDCELLVMNGDMYREMAQQFPVVYKGIKKIADDREVYNRRDREDIIDVLDLYEVRKSHTFEQLAGIRVQPNTKPVEESKNYPTDSYFINKVYLHELQVIFT